MKNLELTFGSFETQEKLEEIGNKFYKGLMDLSHGFVDEIGEVYDAFAMTFNRRRDSGGYGKKTGSGKGRQDGGRRNVNKSPCKKGPGYGKGGGRGSGKRR